jgi:hypothetical protein
MSTDTWCNPFYTERAQFSVVIMELKKDALKCRKEQIPCGPLMSKQDQFFNG